MKRKDPQTRKAEILEAAVRVAERTNYGYMTRDQIAAEAGVSGPMIQHYFGTMCQLRRDVMRAAVRRDIVKIIAQGLIADDKTARKARDEIKQEASRLCL